MRLIADTLAGSSTVGDAMDAETGHKNGASDRIATPIYILLLGNLGCKLAEHVHHVLQ